MLSEERREKKKGKNESNHRDTTPLIQRVCGFERFANREKKRVDRGMRERGTVLSNLILNL